MSSIIKVLRIILTFKNTLRMKGLNTCNFIFKFILTIFVPYSMLGHDCGTEESMTQLGNHRTNLGLLNHSSGLLLLSQGLQEL